MLLLLRQNYLRNKYVCSAFEELRNYTGNLKMPFQSGTFTNESRKSVNIVGKSVKFVSVSDVKFVIKQLKK